MVQMVLVIIMRLVINSVLQCYENVFANNCDECGKIIGIDSKDLSYKEKHWHEACFLCNKVDRVIQAGCDGCDDDSGDDDDCEDDLSSLPYSSVGRA